MEAGLVNTPELKNSYASIRIKRSCIEPLSAGYCITSSNHLIKIIVTYIFKTTSLKLVI